MPTANPNNKDICSVYDFVQQLQKELNTVIKITPFLNLVRRSKTLIVVDNVESEEQNKKLYYADSLRELFFSVPNWKERFIAKYHEVAQCNWAGKNIKNGTKISVTNAANETRIGIFAGYKGTALARLILGNGKETVFATDAIVTTEGIDKDTPLSNYDFGYDCDSHSKTKDFWSVMAQQQDEKNFIEAIQQKKNIMEKAITHDHRRSSSNKLYRTARASSNQAKFVE